MHPNGNGWQRIIYGLQVLDINDPEGTDDAIGPISCSHVGAMYVTLAGGDPAFEVGIQDALNGIGSTEPALAVRSANYGWDWTQAGISREFTLGIFGEPYFDFGTAFSFFGVFSNSAVYGYDIDADDGSMMSVAAIATPNSVQLGGTVQALLTASVLYAADDTGLGVRVSNGSASTLGAQTATNAVVATPPGEWSVTHAPAANTQATITRAAGAAGVRHVCKSITASAIGLAAAAEATVTVTLRDGASGAGTILWSQTIYIPAGGQNGIALSGLNIVGSAATAMTLEFSAGGGANTFESVSLSGYDAE